MTSALEFLALLCLLSASIWFAVTRSWPMVLLALGLTLALLTETSIINL